MKKMGEQKLTEKTEEKGFVLRFLLFHSSAPTCAPAPFQVALFQVAACPFGFAVLRFLPVWSVVS